MGILEKCTRVVSKCGNILHLVGVFPTTSFLKDSGIEINERGFIPVDKVTITTHKMNYVYVQQNVFMYGTLHGIQALNI